MYNHHSESAPDSVSLVLNYAPANDRLFTSDPITSPYEFKKEVVQWLKQSEGSNISQCPPQPTPEDLQTFYEFLRPAEQSLSYNISPSLNLTPECPKYHKEDELCSPASTFNSSYSPPYMGSDNALQASHPLLLQFLQAEPYKNNEFMPAPSNYCNYTTNHYSYQYHPYMPSTDKEKTLKMPVDRTNRGAAGQLHKNSVCSNCKTTETPLWRWNANGEVECNACNIYQARNNRKRPVSLRKDKILRRKRHPHKAQAC